MVRIRDGFAIATEDLRLRGPGSMIGTKQSGLPTMHIADLATDEAILLEARKVVQKILLEDRTLADGAHSCIKDYLDELSAANQLNWAEVG